MGRIADFCTDKGFAITGGQRNRGFRERDITIMSLFNNESKTSYRKLITGCRHFELQWVSQLLSEDSSTFVTELQNYKQEFNGTYDVRWYSEDCFGNRVERVNACSAKEWLHDVKEAVIKYKEICLQIW